MVLAIGTESVTLISDSVRGVGTGGAGGVEQAVIKNSAAIANEKGLINIMHSLFKLIDLPAFI